MFNIFKTRSVYEKSFIKHINGWIKDPNDLNDPLSITVTLCDEENEIENTCECFGLVFTVASKGLYYATAILFIEMDKNFNIINRTLKSPFIIFDEEFNSNWGSGFSQLDLNLQMMLKRSEYDCNLFKCKLMSFPIKNGKSSTKKAKKYLSKEIFRLYKHFDGTSI